MLFLYSFHFIFSLKNFPQDNQKVRLSVSGFLCAFEIPVPGSPTSASSPVQTGKTKHILFSPCLQRPARIDQVEMEMCRKKAVLLQVEG